MKIPTSSWKRCLVYEEDIYAVVDLIYLRITLLRVLQDGSWNPLSSVEGKSLLPSSLQTPTLEKKKKILKRKRNNNIELIDLTTDSPPRQLRIILVE